MLAYALGSTSEFARGPNVAASLRATRGKRAAALGELITCTRCIGGWCELNSSGSGICSPRAERTVSAVLATAVALLTERANTAAALSSRK